MPHLATVLGANLARLAGVPDAVADLIVPLGSPDKAIASILDGNPLADDWFAVVDVPGPLLVAYSGTLAKDLFGDEPRTWMGAGHAAFDELCAAMSPVLQRNERRLLFQPHARHVLSDPQACVDFLRTRSEEPFGIAVSPCDFFVRDMVEAKADHFARIAESVIPKAELLFLHDKRLGDGDLLETCPLGEGILPESILENAAEGTAIVVTPDDAETARAWMA